MNIIELYKENAALEHLLALDSAAGGDVLSLADANHELRKKKVDAMYIVLKQAEADLEHWSEESRMLADAKRHTHATINRIKNLVHYATQCIPNVGNELQGNQYAFKYVRNKNYVCEIKSDPQLWDALYQQEFTYEECTTQAVTLRSATGELISEKTSTSTKLVPNKEALINAHLSNEPIPDGVKVRPSYAIRTKRVASKARSHSNSFLREVDSTVIPERGEAPA